MTESQWVTEQTKLLWETFIFSLLPFLLSASLRVVNLSFSLCFRETSWMCNFAFIFVCLLACKTLGNFPSFVCMWPNVFEWRGKEEERERIKGKERRITGKISERMYGCYYFSTLLEKDWRTLCPAILILIIIIIKSMTCMLFRKMLLAVFSHFGSWQNSFFKSTFSILLSLNANLYDTFICSNISLKLTIILM